MIAVCIGIVFPLFVAIHVLALSLCAAAKRGDRVHLPAPAAEDAAA